MTFLASMTFILVKKTVANSENAVAQKQKCDFRKDFTPCCKLTPSHSIVLKNGCVMISMNPDSLLHPRRSAGFLLRNPLRMEAALTLNDLGMRMVFSKITWNKVNLLREGHTIWKNLPLCFDVTGYIDVKTNWEISWIFAALELRFSETATKFEKISYFVLTLLGT